MIKPWKTASHQENDIIMKKLNNLKRQSLENDEIIEKALAFRKTTTSCMENHLNMKPGFNNAL